MLILLIELLDDPTNTLRADIGYGLVARLVCNALCIARFRKLDENELSVAAVLLVHVENSLGSGTGPGEKI